MTDAERKRRLKASENFRLNRAQQGQAQVNIWLDQALREQVDQIIKAGQFKNRSELVAAALNNMLEQKV